MNWQKKSNCEEDLHNQLKMAVSKKIHTLKINKERHEGSRLRVNSKSPRTEVLELLPPGSFATIKNQPNDLPPFQVINCKGGRCLVRQQAWGRHVHWEVEHNRLKSA